jgi:hypothetical protein
MELSGVTARLDRYEVSLEKLMGLVQSLAATVGQRPASLSDPAGEVDTTTGEASGEEKDGLGPSTPIQPTHTGEAVEADPPTAPTTVVRSLSGLLSPVSASKNTVKLHGTRVTTALPAIYDIPAASSAGHR